MNEDREIFNALKSTVIFQKFSKKYKLKSFELFDNWVEEFLNIYSDYSKGGKLEQVAIVDFLDLGTKSEFEVFRAAFERAGVKCEICDIRNLEYKEGRLYTASGFRIDAIYRRAVTSECMDRLDEIEPFIRAVLDMNICLIGSFKTQIIHNKNIFRIFRHPSTKKLLSKKENEFIEKHIPLTIPLEKGEFSLDEVVKNKDKWLIKPADRYASIGVKAGGDYSNGEWQEIIEKVADSDYLLQEYCTPYKITNCHFDKKGGFIKKDYNTIMGIFVYNGKVKGYYARSVEGLITTEQNEGRVECTVQLEGNQNPPKFKHIQTLDN